MSVATDLEDLKYRLEEEGESYALLHYYGRHPEKHLPDLPQETLELWRAAYDALVSLSEHMGLS